jgi:branched-chain amino acid transport system substrate-binding protein
VADVPRPGRSRSLTAIGLVAGLSVLAAGACTGDDDTVAPTTSVSPTTTTTIVRETDGVLEIGIYLPTTGPGASLGEPMIAAAVETIEQINAAGGVLGSAIRYEVVDEGGSGTGPAALLEGGADAIIGPASSREALEQLGTITQGPTAVVTCSPSATAIALDDYPSGLFFRTAPSDSLQMTAIERRAERTGVTSIAIGYLDDPYGRALSAELVDEIDVRERGQTLVAQEPFGSDQEDLGPVAEALLADDPGVIVVLGDADDGGRLLSALDVASDGDPPQVIVNDSIRTAATIQQLSNEFRDRLTGVAPLATTSDAPSPFTAHTIDCVNLLALAAERAGTDDPDEIKIRMPSVSGGGRQCTSFETCIALLDQGLQIDYNGESGSIELSTVSGDPTRATFVTFGFDVDGSEIDTQTLEVP